MILLWGLLTDSPLAAVHGALATRGAPLLLVDQRQVLDSAIELRVDGAISGRLTVRGSTVDLSGLRSAYLRPYDWRQLRVMRQAGEGSAEWAHAAGFEEAFWAWADCSPALVLSPPSVMMSNNSKPYQAGLIRAQGFQVPTTLLTTDPDAAREFWASHGEVVYKSVSGVRSIVSRLRPDHRERLDHVRWCPTQFQEYVPGVDHRVHVVGDRVFCSRVVSEADDYRYAGRSGPEPEVWPIEIGEPLASRCVALAHGLGLMVAGIDLRLTPAGEWYCFEVNPSPAFSYYDREPGEPIAAAVATLLSEA